MPYVADVVPCENGPRCTVGVFEANVNGVAKWFEAEPHPEGAYQIRPGSTRAIAVRLNTAQQFGKTGILHRVHKCPAAPRKKR